MNRYNKTISKRVALMLSIIFAGATPFSFAQSIYSPTPDNVVGEDGSLLTPTFSGQSRLTSDSVLRGSGPHVAIVAAASGDITDSLFTDPRDKLVATGLFGSVTIIHAGLETPSVADLLEFDAVLTWSNFDFADSVALGDNLADYVDAGGGVVLSVFANTADQDNRFLSGRWETQEYGVIAPQNADTTGLATLGTIIDPLSPLVTGVTAFSGGTLSARPDTTDLTTNGNSVLVANWSDGQPLITFRDDLTGTRVDLGFYPPSSDALFFFWDSATDGDVMLANALLFAARPPEVDVQLQLIPVSAPSVSETTTDPQLLPGILTTDDCYGSFVLELWASDIGTNSTGILGFYVDLAFDNQVLQADSLVHSAIFPTFPEGVIDNPGGMVTNFGGFTFTPQGVAPDWSRIGYVQMTVLAEAPTLVTSDLGLAGIAMSNRPPPAIAEIGFGVAALEPFLPGDSDFDCDVDLADFAAFQSCFGIVGVPPQCEFADLIDDDMIDDIDYAAFEAQFTGPPTD